MLHVEVQGQRAPNFAKRMFTYYYRLLDQFDQDVISVALLTDANPRWRPAVSTRGEPATLLHFAYTVGQAARLAGATERA